MYFGINDADTICISSDGYNWQSFQPTGLVFNDIVYVGGYYFSFEFEYEPYFSWTGDLKGTWTNGSLDDPTAGLAYFFESEGSIYAVAVDGEAVTTVSE